MRQIKQFYMHADTMKYILGFLLRRPLRFHTSVLWFILRRGLRGCLRLQAITSRSACRRWDNKGDRTQPQGGEDCAGVYIDLPIYFDPLGATLISSLEFLGTFLYSVFFPSRLPWPETKFDYYHALCTKLIFTPYF